MTHGPAMRNSSAPPISTRPTLKLLGIGFEARRTRRGTKSQYFIPSLPSWPSRLALYFFPPQEQLLIQRHLLFHHALALLVGCADERAEEWMRLERLRFEFRMELAANKERMI